MMNAIPPEEPEAGVARGSSPEPNKSQQPDWYIEHGLLVYTVAFHLKRGFCCGSGCRHCPYEPRHVEGGTRICS